MMLETYIYGFVSVMVVSLISLVGIFALTLKDEVLKKSIFVMIGLAVGALLGDAFIHLIPEAFKNSSNTLLTSLLLVAGILLFFTMEKFFHWHHHGEDKEDVEIHPVGKLILFSDSIHNFTDGIIIGVSFLVSIPVGIATTLAVISHEIPQEIGNFAVLIHSGYTKGKALLYNFISALTAILGLIAAFVAGNLAQSSSTWILPLAAGGFIYVATADLIPELHKTIELKYSFYQILAILVGISAMILLLFLE